MTPYEQLDELYATLPKVQCQRKCQDYCGPILIPKIEAKRLEEHRGFLETIAANEPSKRSFLPTPEIIKREFIGLKPTRKLVVLQNIAIGLDIQCVFLSDFGACVVYGIRPLVCRLWGCVDNEHMRCPFGCQPDRWMSNEEYRSTLEKVIEIQKLRK